MSIEPAFQPNSRKGLKPSRGLNVTAGAVLCIHHTVYRSLPIPPFAWLTLERPSTTQVGADNQHTPWSLSMAPKAYGCWEQTSIQEQAYRQDYIIYYTH